MEQIEIIAEKAGRLLQAKIEQNGEKMTFKRQRTFEICTENNRFTCTLELDISFKGLQPDGSAFNQAEIFLLPEEFSIFTSTLSEHRYPFPTHYRQWQNANPNIVSVCLESTEPPEHFAERLSAALTVLER